MNKFDEDTEIKLLITTKYYKIFPLDIIHLIINFLPFNNIFCSKCKILLESNWTIIFSTLESLCQNCFANLNIDYY